MNELGGPRGRAGSEILALDEADSESTRDGVKRDAGAGGAAADNEQVERAGRVGADQRRGLSRPGRNDDVGVGDPLPNCRYVGPGFTAVVGGERRPVEQDSASGCGGDCCGAYSPAQACSCCHTVRLERESKRERERDREQVDGIGI